MASFDPESGKFDASSSRIRRFDPESSAASCGLQQSPHASRVFLTPNPIDSAALPMMDGNNIPLLLLALFSPLAGGFRPLEARNQWFSGSLSRVSSSGAPEFGEVQSRFAMASSGDGENGENRRTQLDHDEPGDSSLINASSMESGPSSRVSRWAAEEIGMAKRLMDVFIGGGDGDLLLQRSDREDRVLQWLQVLDMQVVGAYRADERLKPLLKSSGSSSTAEDRLLAHLS